MKIRVTTKFVGSGITDSLVPDVNCDHCGQPTGKTFGELKAVPRFVCSCGGDVDATQAVDRLRQIQILEGEMDAIFNRPGGSS